MVKTFLDLFSPDEIQWFKDDMAEKIKTDYVDREFDREAALKIFGVDCSIHDRRYIMTQKDEAYQRLMPTIREIIPTDVEIYVAYQRQYLPHLLHVDEVHDHTRMDWAYSAIIPLDANLDDIFKTIVWAKVCPRYQELSDFFQDFIRDSSPYPKVNDVSSNFDVDHVWTGIPHICDHMPLDGVYVYELGSMGMFNRAHVHCSSNWKKYNLWEYKDIIILHIG